ncbi:MAG: aminopeptidase P family protein [Lachnospiraceae bacterium]|nr:aminopeptidase P family protein [Lachnospiraceae bacterium]
MNREFHMGNREKLIATLPQHSLTVIFAGHAPMKTGDEPYPFYANRNFVYLTGITQEDSILLIDKTPEQTRQILFALPPDEHAERWTGRRVKAYEAERIAGITEFMYLDQFDSYVHRCMKSDHYNDVCLDLYQNSVNDADSEAIKYAAKVRQQYAWVKIHNISLQLKRQRVIKQPCEIEAMRKAAVITRAGIVAMMKASKPGMWEYEYKAEFDYALTKAGCLSPGFPSIISAGDNNFCIHYYAYTGQAKDGDMILNDVAAQYDGLTNDVSRGWPCNGKFTEKQRALYQCAYNTSQHMFSIIRPGMKMRDVDRLAREYNFEQLKAIGLLDDYKDIGKYMWHGGAHHVGYDVHDIVDVDIIEPGMVFCVDIGIYVLEWGIGFRLEDNCLVTEDGCENLTANIPRTIEDIEAVMAGEME